MKFWPNSQSRIAPSDHAVDDMRRREAITGRWPNCPSTLTNSALILFSGSIAQIAIAGIMPVMRGHVGRVNGQYAAGADQAQNQIDSTPMRASRQRHKAQAMPRMISAASIGFATGSCVNV